MCQHSEGQLAAGPKKKPAASKSKTVPSSNSASLPSTVVPDALPGKKPGCMLELDLAALREIVELDIDSHLVTGKKSCTILFGPTGQRTSVKSECLFNVCVNLSKRSFWIYGGTEADGNAPSKRNHGWATTSPRDAWQDVHAAMSEHSNQDAPPKKKSRAKGKAAAK